MIPSAIGSSLQTTTMAHNNFFVQNKKWFLVWILQWLYLSSRSSFGFSLSKIRARASSSRVILRSIDAWPVILPQRKISSSSLQSSSTTTTYDSQKEASTDVTVYDSIFSQISCQVLHALSLDHSLRVNSETCGYIRPPFNTTYLTPLELAMESALEQMDGSFTNTKNNGDDSPILVEYWSRTEYMNMDAHVDVDEYMLQEGTIRYPQHGHILYLQISKDLQAPTCVFSNQRVGWTGGQVDLVTIPAIEGRLVRFPGDAMHAVPYPAHRWFLTPEELHILEEEEAEEDEDADDANDADDDEDEDEDDYEQEDEEYDDFGEAIERSVLLFNTWPITPKTPPPRNICSDPMLNQHDNEGLRHLVEEWDMDFGKDAAWIRCQSRSDWSAVRIRNAPLLPSPFFSNNDHDDTTIRIPLMGDANRHLFSQQTARVQIPSSSCLSAALVEDKAVTYFQLLGSNRPTSTKKN